MPLNLGDEFPNFTAKATDDEAGEKKFHDRIGNGWAILFSHPADYTPVCTTELARVVKLLDEFKKRNCKVFALSCDDVASHKGWAEDVMGFAEQAGKPLPYPIFADEKRELAKKLGMVDPDEKDAKGMPVTCRAVFVIGPDKKVKLSILYPATTGRNFDEILRVLDSLQLTATKKVATPVDWKMGDKCMVIPSVKEEEARSLFPDHQTIKVTSGKEYLRMTPQPK